MKCFTFNVKGTQTETGELPRPGGSSRCFPAPSWSEEMEDLDEAIESFERSIGALKAQGPLTSAFASEVLGALADAYFEALFLRVFVFF